MTLKTEAFTLGTSEVELFRIDANSSARVLAAVAANYSPDSDVPPQKPLTLKYVSSGGATPGTYFLSNATPLDNTSSYLTIAGKLVMSAGDSIRASTNTASRVDMTFTYDVVSADSSLITVSKSYSGTGSPQKIYEPPTGNAARIIHSQIASRHSADVPIFLYIRTDDDDQTCLLYTSPSPRD